MGPRVLLDFGAGADRDRAAAWACNEAAMADDHFPSCATTPSHRAMRSAEEARSDGCLRTAACTMTSLEAGSTKIIWPRIPIRAKIRCSPGRIHTWYP